jgi:hypothetical protein
MWTVTVPDLAGPGAPDGWGPELVEAGGLVDVGAVLLEPPEPHAAPLTAMAVAQARDASARRRGTGRKLVGM